MEAARGADVVITGGRAHCVPARPVTALAVRLALFREWPVIDKSLLVYPREGGGARTVAMVQSLTLGDATLGLCELLFAQTDARFACAKVEGTASPKGHDSSTQGLLAAFHRLRDDDPGA